MNDTLSDWIPEGYVITLDPDDRQYIVLEFMVLAMHQAYQHYRHKKDFNAFGAAGGVSFPPFPVPFLSQALGGWLGILNTGRPPASGIYTFSESCTMASRPLSHIPIFSNSHCLPTDP